MRTPRLIAAIGTTFAVVIDMLAMVALMLLYDGIIVIAIFAVEFSHYSKNDSGKLHTESIGIGWLGIAVGILGVVFLVARQKKYYRLVAASIGLAPLVLFTYSQSVPRWP